MRRSLYVIAAVLLVTGLMHRETAFALADGYYDSTWPTVLGGGRTTFQGDEIGDDQYHPPGPGSQVDRIYVGPNGDLLLFGLAESGDTWLGGMHADGSWILTFGLSNGFGRTTLCYLSGLCDLFASAVIQPDGEYLVLGGSAIERTSSLATQLNAIRWPTTFDAIDNVVGGHIDAGAAIAAQSDGKVLVAGSGYISAADNVPKFGVVRVNSNLTVDTTFNNITVGDVIFSGGAIIGVSAGETEGVTDILLQPDGRIILVGYGVLPSPSSPLIGTLSLALELVRLKSDGTLDTTFGAGGAVALTWPSGTIKAIGKATLDRAGRVVVPLWGTDTAFGHPDMVVARVTSSGSLDGTFGQDAGFARFSESGACSSIYSNAVALDSAGRVLVVGDCFTPANDEYFIVIRLRGDTGYLDGSFGISGYGLGAFAAADTQSHGSSVVFDSSGHPIIGGAANTGTGKAGIARLTYDLIYTNNFENTPRGCLPPDCSP